MTAKTSNVKCAACPRHLGTTNTNPDGLCGPCQGYLKRGSDRYNAWVQQGRPPLKDLLKAFPVAHIHRPRRQLALRLSEVKPVEPFSGEFAPVHALPLPYLAACVAEFKRRMDDAAATVAMAKKMGVR